MTKRKVSAPLAEPTGPQAVVIAAQREIDSLEKDIAAVEAIISDMETQLRAISPRDAARTERRREAHLQREEAKERLDEATVYADLSRGTANEAAAVGYLEASKAMEVAEKQLRRELAAIEKKEDQDSDLASRLLATQTSARLELARRQKRMEQLLKARDTAHESHGKHLHKTVDLQFEALSDQKAAAEATLADIEAQQVAAVEAARVTLADYPEHLATLINKHVLYEDDVTRLVEGLLQWRKIVLDEQVVRLAEQYAIPLNWLVVDMASEPAQWRASNSRDIEKWLQDYKARR